MIREANEQDFDEIVDLSSEFWTHSPYHKEEFIRSDVLEKVKQCFDESLLAVIDVGGVVGFCAGLTLPLLANNVIKAGIEIAWYIDPNHRGNGNGKALKIFMENLARKQKVKYWCMVSMETSMPAVIEKMYVNSGYIKTETTYMKAL